MKHYAATFTAPIVVSHVFTKQLFSDIIHVIKSIRIRWAGHVAHMGKRKSAYRFLAGKPEERRLLGKPRSRWEKIIKTDLQDVGWRHELVRVSRLVNYYCQITVIYFLPHSMKSYF
jgi:hypothetical protein